MRYIDPPSGWKYGFPKELPEGVDHITFLIENGYPEKEIKSYGDAFSYRIFGKMSTPYEDFAEVFRENIRAINENSYYNEEPQDNIHYNEELQEKKFSLEDDLETLLKKFTQVDNQSKSFIQEQKIHIQEIRKYVKFHREKTHDWDSDYISLGGENIMTGLSTYYLNGEPTEITVHKDAPNEEWKKAYRKVNRLQLDTAEKRKND